MTSVVFAVLLILAACFVPRYVACFVPRYVPDKIANQFGWLKNTIRGVCGVLAVICVLSTSIIRVPADQVGVVRKVFGGSNLPEGHIIATKGETGYQAEIIPPGTFRVSVFFNIFNEIENMPLVNIPQGFYGRIVARDGATGLREGQIMADAWSDKSFADYLNAPYFMEHGQRGLQLSVLTPGTYPLNLKLFQVKVGFIPRQDVKSVNDWIYDENGFHQEDTPLDTSITKVPAGFVGVVRSSVQATGVDCTPKKATVGETVLDQDSLSAVLVPQGCKGIWADALPPNDYYLNRDAYDITLVDTKVQTLEFKGGFRRRAIDLTINANGDFEQKERVPLEVPIADGAVDAAVYAKIEGWEIPQELRAVVQISPSHAPIIVAAVGGLKDVETRIMIPAIRSHVRNVFGGNITIIEDGKSVIRQTKVLDTIEQRPLLENAILRLVQIDGKRAGVDVKEIRLGESSIPPELLLARQRQQLAGQLKEAFQQEKIAQDQRKEVALARAQADQQHSLVTAQIGVQVATQNAEKRAQDGIAEQRFMEATAKGQQALTAVLGADRVFMGTIVDKIMAALKEHPEMVANQKWPQYLFLGGSDTTNGLGMLATSPMLKSLMQTPPK